MLEPVIGGKLYMVLAVSVPKSGVAARVQALAMSTLAFTVCFAVWTLFSIIGVKIKQELALNDSEFGVLIATPVLTGALSRLFLGLLSDKLGGRRVFALLMLLTSGAVYGVSAVSSYGMFLLTALGLGFAGGSFAVGVSYVSSWFDRAKQGTFPAYCGVFVQFPFSTGGQQIDQSYALCNRLFLQRRGWH